SAPVVAAPASAPAPAEQAVPFAIQNVQKDFPVTLYTSPICKMPCEQAREVLNRRGIPFSEVQVWDTEGLEKLKTLANSDKVPTILVGHTSIVGLDPARYDSLLNSAGYPQLGAFPPRAQKSPALPAGYEPPPVAEPVKAEAASATPQKSGPYDSSGLQDPSAKPQKAGQYDPSGLQGPPPKPGGYKLPDTPG